VYFGSGAYGIESAARLYFDKPATELDLAESALLAGIVQSPSRQSPRVSMDAAMARRATVLANMAQVGVLTAEDAALIRDAPIELAEPRARAGADNYFAEHVRRRLEQMLGTEAVWQGGYRVYTTLDSRLQATAEEVIATHVEAIERTVGADKVRRAEWLERREAGEEPVIVDDDEFVAATPYLQGILVSVDLQTGGIVAMVGGRSFEESKFNRVTQGLRQPGSVFKPFVYSAAVRSGFPVSYVVLDDPISMEAGDGEIWEPENFDHEFRGPVTLRHALANSINVPTVRLMFDVGVQAVIDYARDAGITTPLPAVESLALGAADVVPIEALRAYTVFPTGGVRVDPISITRIEDRNGIVVRTFSPSTTRVLTPQEAYIVTSVLEDVVNHGTARFGVRGQGFEWPTGGKTGTTNDSTDAWFVGFTPRYLTLTWVGFDRKQRIRFNGTGGVLAAPIWTDFMKVAHDGLEIPSERFPRPEGLEEVEVTTTTGMLAAAFCGMPSYVEVVIPGTAPEHYCRTPVEPGVPLLEGPLRGDPRGRGEESEPVGDDFLF
jgi:penicillin-binding protein 1A